MRLEIADGRAREKPDACRRSLGFFRQFERVANVGRHRQHLELRKIGPQLGRFLLDHLAADIDRHVGRKLRRRAQQNTRLLAGAAAELNQRRAFRDQFGDVGSVVAQSLHLATGRIVLRQFGDTLEQLRAGSVVEIFRRHMLGCRVQAFEYIGLECGDSACCENSADVLLLRP